MDFESLAMGPLLWLVSLIFILGILIRLAFFIFRMLNSNRDEKQGWHHKIILMGRSLLPFHRAVTKKAVYAATRYVFHICLIAAPVWFSGHIVFWEESRFEWSYLSLPDVWADWMTLLVIILSIYFFIRRLLMPDLRLNSSKADYLLILITALPFITGYIEAHDSLYFIPSLSDHMLTIHVLSGEAFLIAVVFLFCRTRLNKESCTGCASCEISCPTDTLLSSDKDGFRIFTYLSCQCIVCGACVDVCPEEASELRHNISFKSFFRMASRQIIHKVQLRVCDTCGAFFSPELQLVNIGSKLTNIGQQPADYINLCTNCRMYSYADKVKNSTGRVRFARV
ncbi:MAG: 4Fe-4S binding protein [Deltaproteobacteria bacterium]|nr:4Fe-4S binding protein [Deltaproteobacteria bacterium]